MNEVLTEREAYCFPNKMSRILLLSMHDVIGQNGLHAVLNIARLPSWVDSYPPPDFESGLTFEEIGRLMEAVEGIYGIRGGRRLIKQSGHHCFKYGIEGFGSVIGFADFVLRLVPVRLRVRIGLEVLAEIFNRYSDQVIILAEDEERYLFMVKQCGFCWGRQTVDVACALLEGLLEETLYWVTRGRRFMIEEFACLAAGQDMCAIQVGKVPLN